MFMGKYHENRYKYSVFGAMTDVNIWDRLMTQSEVEQWSRCELGAGGNMLDWNTAQWEAVGLQEEEVDIEKVCRKELMKKHLMVLQEKKTFDEAVKRCRVMGGEVAVGSNKQTLQEMIDAVEPLKNKCG